MSHANFVSTDWLDAHLGDPDLRVIDASWHLPTTARKGDAEFREGHIPGAVFFNIDAIADTSSSLPHMLPDAGRLRQGDGRARARRRHAFRHLRFARAFTRRRACGGRCAPSGRRTCSFWKAACRNGCTRVGRSRAGEANPKPAMFTPRLDPSMVAGLAEVKAALASGSAQVVDARPADRFEGRAPEPRPGLKKRPHAGLGQPALCGSSGAGSPEAARPALIEIFARTASTWTGRC